MAAFLMFCWEVLTAPAVVMDSRVVRDAGPATERRSVLGRPGQEAEGGVAAATPCQDAPPRIAKVLESVAPFSQAKAATELALKDNKELLEIEFPTAGLESVPGDGEGRIEMTKSMQFIREFCDRLVVPEKITRTRVDDYLGYSGGPNN